MASDAEVAVVAEALAGNNLPSDGDYADARAMIIALDKHRAAQADDEAQALVRKLVGTAAYWQQCLCTPKASEAFAKLAIAETAVLARMRGVVIDDTAIERARDAFLTRVAGEWPSDGSDVLIVNGHEAMRAALGGQP